jgi:hypothetical protein
VRRSGLRGPGELLPLLLLLAVALWFWPRAGAVPGLPLDAPPWWGAPRDQLLDGPDAGEWARNALLLSDGRLSALDHHRMPGWLVVLAAGHQLIPDVVLVGHLGNRLLHVVTVVAAYVLGRAGGGRAGGLLAGALVLGIDALAVTAQRFGVDAAVSAAVTGSLAAAALAARWGVLAPLAGAVAGWATGVHYTTLPFALPALVVLLLRGGPGLGRRVLLALGFAAGFGAVGAGLWAIWPAPDLHTFLQDIANGARPGARGDGTVGDVGGLVETLRARVPLALGRAVGVGLSGVGVPRAALGVAAVAVWLGVAGLGLRGRRPGRLVGWDPGLGLGLLCALAPLPIFVAVGAPARYGENLLPVVAVLLARGVVGVAAVADAGVGARVRGWPARTLPTLAALAVGAAVVWGAAPRRGPRPLSQPEVGTLLLADALRENFPSGTEIACPVREAIVMAGLGYCPERICPLTADDAAFRACVEVLDAECAGEGPIGYIATNATHLYDPNALGRRPMDAWVDATHGRVATVSYRDFEAVVHHIPRPAAGPP